VGEKSIFCLRIGFLLCNILSLFFCGTLRAEDLLIQLRNDSPASLASFEKRSGGSVEVISRAGKWFRWSGAQTIPQTMFSALAISRAEPNRKIRLFPNPTLPCVEDLTSDRWQQEEPPFFVDNPPLEPLPSQGTGVDPLVVNSWGLLKIGAPLTWATPPQGKGLTVAVVDTGVDYNHPDLIHNIWHNFKEIPADGIDNDGNGYIDDNIGWDFVSGDNLPYDLSLNLMEIIFKHGNAGHGTHIAGILGARYANALGIAGVAPSIRLMPLRVLDEHGEGTTANLIKAIDYAIENGAKIINASWGTEGAEADDRALRDAVQRAEKADVFLVAAAGNGRKKPGCNNSVGYDNDTDSKPSYPASYSYSNVISVAAVDSADELARFSNFGATTVHLAAPGVKILSTVPGNRYQDTIVETSHTIVTWDGTSMATPFVSGALAVIWSQTHELSAVEVRKKLFSTTALVPALSGKVATGGRVDLQGIRLPTEVGRH
jgi:thermitase